MVQREVVELDHAFELAQAQTVGHLVIPPTPTNIADALQQGEAVVGGAFTRPWDLQFLHDHIAQRDATEVAYPGLITPDPKLQLLDQTSPPLDDSLNRLRRTKRRAIGGYDGDDANLRRDWNI